MILLDLFTFLALASLAFVQGCPDLNGGDCLSGITYSPYNTDGSCPDANKVSEDLKTVAGIAKSIRIYSTDCSQLASVIKAVDSGTTLDIHAGIWLSDGDERFKKDLDEFVEAVKPVVDKGYVKDVSVGNEILFGGKMSEEDLIGHINQVKERLSAEGIDIPVYTTDTDAKFSANLASASDIIQVNIYAVFDSTYTSLDDSVTSVFDRLENVRQTTNAKDKPVRIGESGWASSGSTGAVPTTVELEQDYLKKFYCQAKDKNVDYFFFEAKDAEWKTGASPLEKSFGVFKSDYSSKISLDGVGQC